LAKVWAKLKEARLCIISALMLRERFALLKHEQKLLKAETSIND
jgi:hypothetical protein